MERISDDLAPLDSKPKTSEEVRDSFFRNRTFRRCPRNYRLYQGTTKVPWWAWHEAQDGQAGYRVVVCDLSSCDTARYGDQPASGPFPLRSTIPAGDSSSRGTADGSDLFGRAAAIPIAACECVRQTFLSAGSGEFPLAAGLESPANRQARRPAPTA
jgi:hypothetical protein